MLSDATQPGWVRECDGIGAISFVAKKYQLPGSPPTSYGVIHGEARVYTQNSFGVLHRSTYQLLLWGFLRTDLL